MKMEFSDFEILIFIVAGVLFLMGEIKEIKEFKKIKD
jgi:hypothetical protein